MGSAAGTGATSGNVRSHAGTGSETQFEYDAFVSYSHAADSKLAPMIEQQLRRFAMPVLRFWRQWSVRIFRDITNLSTTPHLWPEIEKKLAASRHLILFASPQAAKSRWVEKEVGYWLEHRGTEGLLIVLTAGIIKWDDAVDDFDWKATDALPKVLAKRFPAEPKWEDARVLATASDVVPGNPVLMQIVASLYAAITGQHFDTVIGEDVRQRRRRVQAVAALGLVVAGLIGAAGFIYVDAQAQRRLDAESRVQETLARQQMEAGDVAEAAGLLTRQLERNAGWMQSREGGSAYFAMVQAAQSGRDLAVLRHESR